MSKKPYIGLFISIASVSLAAIFIVSCEAPPLSIAFYRMLFTTLIILPFAVLHKKTRTELLSLSSSNFITMISVGFILAAHFALWITSLTKTSVASSVILVTAHPILVASIAHVFFKERLSPVNTLGITFSLLGVTVLLTGNYGLKTMTLQGNTLALLGGIAAGLYILGGRKLRKTISTTSYVVIVYSTATMVLLILCLTTESPLYNLSIRDYHIILLMAFISGILGHTLYNWSLKYIKASVASVSLLGEPIGSSLLAFALPWIQQTPSIYTIIGGSIILSGIYLTAKNSVK
ncbi:MAG TPA: DMT family transporter [Thermoplasmatales archaeon]|nr:DMT family transporter [Thermoplasmatales archaeon]